MIRILIAEDHLIARAGLTAILNAQPDMQVVAEAINGQQAVALFRERRPEIALMDMRMPSVNGFEAAGLIRREFPDARIIAVSTFAGDEDVRRAFASGVQAYLSKDVLHDELLAAIRSVHAGQRYLTASVEASLAAGFSAPVLTARELGVLKLVVQGLMNKQIAYALGIAEYTVKNHVKSILEKLGAEDRTQAATAAIQRGIVHLDD